MLFSLFVSLILSCLVSDIASNNDTCGFSSQCIYNIQVKHCSGQKSQVRNFRSSPSCNCALVSQVATAASGMRNWTDNVVREFNEVAESLRGSKYQLEQKQSELLSISKQNQDRNVTLRSHSDSLVKTNNAIVKERQNWAAEKSRLQKELMNVHREIQICKSSLPSNSSTNSTVSVTSTLTFCNFESTTLCGYHQDKDEDLDWSRGSNTLHSSTGPEQDHTYGNPQGHYMYIDAYGQASRSSSSKTKIARLTSPTFPPAKGYCILFWYNLHGSDIQDLKVYAKIGGGLGNPVFQRTGQIDENWHLGQIDLDSEYTASSFQIVFEGSTKAYIYYYYNSHVGRQHDNRYEHGNIAIDDVYAYNTSCHNVPRYPKNTYVYTNGSSTTRYTFNTTPTSWFDAQNACKNEGPTSHLISINSQEEQAFIVNTIKRVENIRVAGMNGFYTSGSDERSENTFEWTDTGTPYALSYKNWHPGQPNNVAGAQNCLLLQYPEEFEWGDVSCDEKHPFICEINDSFDGMLLIIFSALSVLLCCSAQQDQLISRDLFSIPEQQSQPSFPGPQNQLGFLEQQNQLTFPGQSSQLDIQGSRNQLIGPSLPECFLNSQCGIGRRCRGGRCFPECIYNFECPLGRCLNGVCSPINPISTCFSNAQCGPEGRCRGGRCVAAQPICFYDFECGPSSECQRGRCVARPGCRRNSDCAFGQRCNRGVCVRARPGCRRNSDCVFGQRCNRGVCVRARPGCRRNSDCAFGQRCNRGVCVRARPGCIRNSDCAFGQRCNRGVCVRGPISQQCTYDFQCQSNICLGGSCLPFQEGCRNDFGCPAGSICRRGICRAQQQCFRDSDCPLGRRCRSGTCIRAQCGTDWECSLEEQCISGRCIRIDACTRNSECLSGEYCHNDRCMPGRG